MWRKWLLYIVCVHGLAAPLRFCRMFEININRENSVTHRLFIWMHRMGSLSGIYFDYFIYFRRENVVEIMEPNTSSAETIDNSEKEDNATFQHSHKDSGDALVDGPALKLHETAASLSTKHIPSTLKPSITTSSSTNLQRCLMNLII